MAKPADKSQRLFGTDGIRARAGHGPLRPERILALGRALGAHLREASGDKRPVVLLGVDPRPSAAMVGTALVAGLTAEGCDVRWPGMMSTPEVAYLTAHGPYRAGIVVTASHNPAHDNGIKLFDAEGRKLSEEVEQRIEKAALSGAAPERDEFGQVELLRERGYEEYLVKAFDKSFAAHKGPPMGVVVDAAYGSRSIDLQLLSRLAHSIALGSTAPRFRIGANMATRGDATGNALDIYFLNAASPRRSEVHQRINEGCGSLHPEGCAEAVRELEADIGVCFDGDGDRCVLIDEKGEVRDGDHMLALLAADMKERGKLPGDLVVTTTMANLGLERALGAHGIRLLRTDVGDKYVDEAMREHGATLGGEQSGHIIIRDEGHLAGDGLYTALRVIQVMLAKGQPLSKLCEGLKKFPQTIANIRTAAKPPLEGLKNLQQTRERLEGELGQTGRINVRYSGTEPLLRIMVEAEDEATLKAVTDELTKAAEQDLGAA